VIGVHYEPMLGKLIAWAPTRPEAARLLANSLARAQIHGVVTNRDLLVRVLRHPSFMAGATDTSFLDRHPELFAPLMSSVDSVRLSCLAAALAGAAGRRAGSPLRSLPSGWRNVVSAPQTVAYDGPTGTIEVSYRFERTGELAAWAARTVDRDEVGSPGATVDGTTPDEHPPVAVVSAAPDRVILDVNGIRLDYSVHRIDNVSYVDSSEGSATLTELPRFPPSTGDAPEGSLIAPLPGAISRVLVMPGQRVSAGELLLTVEAMKLEHPIHAPNAGIVTDLNVAAGSQVDAGAVLAVVDPD
jgi:propionyl-CoA carboxylase alpha chain